MCGMVAQVWCQTYNRMTMGSTFASCSYPKICRKKEYEVKKDKSLRVMRNSSMSA